MRKVLAILAVLAIAVPATYAANGLGVFGTYWDAEDGEDPGMGGGLKFKMEMAPNISLEIRGSYLQDFFDDDDGISDFVMIPVEADIVINFPLVPDRLNIYGGGGGGYYIFPEFEADFAMPGSTEPDVDPDEEFGFFVLGGAELALNEQLSLFGEAKYNWLEIDEAEIDGVDVDFGDFDEEIEMTGISFNAGLLLTW
jgi:hypothetical protein